jgi:hypothetical protein
MDTRREMATVLLTRKEPHPWPIEPSNAAGKQVTGVGQACNRVLKAVERSVPFAFLVQSLVICWYAISRDPAADVAWRRGRCPWCLAKTSVSAADMHTALRDALASTRINGISLGSSQTPEIPATTLASTA